MTITPETTANLLKTAIRDGLEQIDSNDTDQAVEAIWTTVHAALGPLVAEGVNQALNDPAHQKTITTAMIIPGLLILEDEINDDHDDPTTPDQYRPGLRRAAHLIRDTRRAAQEDQ